MKKIVAESETESSGWLRVKGARVHNLQNVDVQLPRNKLVVFTGLSGSGKSSLAFDTIFIEGQRRYVESLSAYIRQFLGHSGRPDVDAIEGLSPAVAIDQKSTGHNPRSTVGTITEIHDHLRLLWSRVGQPHCLICDKPVVQQTQQQIIDSILALPEGTSIMILAPVVNDQKGEFVDRLRSLVSAGYSRYHIDGVMHSSQNLPQLAKNSRHTIKVVVDRMIIRREQPSSLFNSVEAALKLGEGRMELGLDLLRRGAKDAKGNKVTQMTPTRFVSYSQNLSCPSGHQLELMELEPRIFSFNSPQGYCTRCLGLGVARAADPKLVLSNPRLSLKDGVIIPWSNNGRLRPKYQRLLEPLLRDFDVALETPWEELPEALQQALLHGALPAKNQPTPGKPIRVLVQTTTSGGQKVEFTSTLSGVLAEVEEAASTGSAHKKKGAEQYLRELVCPLCRGQRLRPEVLAVRIADSSIADVCRMPLLESRNFFNRLQLGSAQKQIAVPVLREIEARLNFLVTVGLGYLSLDRPSSSLSGGESQRIRLATQIGSGLTGVLYVLDEPSIGLHQYDNKRLLEAIRNLKALGNTVIVVEHDEETIETADWIVDVGPRAGSEGGRIVYSGHPAGLVDVPESLTGDYLAGRRKIDVPRRREITASNTDWIRVVNASENNLRNIDADFPLRKLTLVTGVSGSGKSTLVNRIMFRALDAQLNGTQTSPGAHENLIYSPLLSRAVHVSQDPIGRNPRSNPATYIGIFTKIRELLSGTEHARAMGYGPGRFSLNVQGGRCDRCQGQGATKVEMRFLADVYVECEDCRGSGFNSDTLMVKYRNKTVRAILDMPVSEALKFFDYVRNIREGLQLLEDVGLGYLPLGQPVTTLSGGESQRVKLARELGHRRNNTLYLLDEPTTGLHFEDVRLLIGVLQRLVDQGNTVVVIEHNLDVIKCADWVIDMGPGGGVAGGEIVGAGAPEEIAKLPKSLTGKFLAPYL